MLFLLLALFVLGPIAEIYVLLAAGAALGVLPVVAACLGTALIGGWIIRLQGVAAVNAARRDLEAGRAPVDSAVDGVLLLVAAPLLMTPGFITDFGGFLLLVPAIRRFLGRAALRAIRRRMDRGEAITIRRW